MIPSLHDAELNALAEAEGQDSAVWQTLSTDVRQASAVSDTLSVDFNAKLRTALTAETARETKAASVPQSNWLRRHFALPRTAGAVAAAVALVAVGVYLGREPAVAWGDVVTATRNVQQCHILIFGDSPRAADPGRQNARLDWYYRSPGQWRVHGMNRVGFVSDGRSKMWNAETKNWATDKIELLPRSLRQGVKDGDLLTALLAAMFDGKPPAGEPVKSDDVTSAEGIDVFDFARDSGQRWARIWVLRASRLPIRAHVYAPQSDAFELVDFDYSDPQPPAFFDAAEFEKAVARHSPATARQAYSVGQRPVAGNRPRGSGQVYETGGGYHAPGIKSVATTAAGDLLIVADDLTNTTPDGQRADREGFVVSDSWGNRYFPAGGRGNFKEYRHYFSPVPPFKTGTGPRQLRLNYRLRAKFDQPDQSLRVETRDAPPPTADPKAFTETFAREKPQWQRTYLDAVGTLPQKLTAIEDRLAADPNDLPALAWQFKLLRQHGREAAAWTLFETKLRDVAFTDAEWLVPFDSLASQYLLYLADTGRDAEAKIWADKAQSAIAAAERVPGNKRQRIIGSNGRETNPLRTAIAALGWRTQFKDAPAVDKVVTSQDGYVFVEMTVPTPPEPWQSTGSVGSAPLGWFYTPNLPADWGLQAQSADLKTGRTMFVYRVAGRTLPLTGEAVLAPDNYSGALTRHDLKLRWRRDIDVPAATVDTMRAYWQLRTHGQPSATWFEASPDAKPHAARPAEALLNQAAKADAAEAYGLVERALELPKEQWADYLSHPANGPDAFERAVRRVKADQAGRLASLGRYDEAKAVAAALWADVPTPIDYADESHVTIAGEALRASLSIARAKLVAGDAQAAEAELETIANRRPDLADVPDGMTIVTHGSGRMTFVPRDRQKEAWKAFDRLWWDVQSAAEK